MARRERRWLATLMVFCVMLTQIITVAHACTLDVPAFGSVTSVLTDGDAMSPDCAATTAVPNANVCDAHCAYGQQIDLQLDAPIAAIAPQPALIVHAPPSLVSRSFDAISLDARSTSPPVSVLFSRFLN